MYQNTVIDTGLTWIIEKIMLVPELLLKFVFSNRIIALLVYFVIVNLLALLLMKKDKKYAQDDKRRIKENTLLITALAGGAFGIFGGMYKYKHKTMHKKFTICVPTIIMFQFAYLSYLVFDKIFA